MKIQDFIKDRNVSYQTVRKYIANHPELFSGHTGQRNKIILDEVAIELLSKKYPLPKPIQVIEDSNARQQLIEAQQLIIQLQQQLVEAAPKIALAEQNAYLLEAALNEKEALQEENDKLNALLQNKQQELEAEKNRRWKFPWSK